MKVIGASFLVITAAAVFSAWPADLTAGSGEWCDLWLTSDGTCDYICTAGEDCPCLGWGEVCDTTKPPLQ